MITRLPVVDDVGDGTSGTPINAAWWTQAQDMIDQRWSIVVLDLGTTGLVNDLNVSEADAVFIANNAPLTITGIAQPNPAKAAKPLRIVHLGPSPLFLPYADPRSLGTSGLRNMVTSGPTPLVGGGATYIHGGAGSAWFMQHHEQAGWVSVPLTGSMFTVTGGVYLPDLPSSTYRYCLIGRTLFLDFLFPSAQVTAAGLLYVTLPPPFQLATGQNSLQLIRALDAGAPVVGLVQPYASRTQMAIYSGVIAGGFAATANGNTLWGRVNFEIT